MYAANTQFLIEEENIKIILNITKSIYAMMQSNDAIVATHRSVKKYRKNIYIQ